MNEVRVLRYAIVWGWIAVLTRLLVGLYEERRLSPELTSYLKALEEGPMTGRDFAFMIIGIPFVILSIVTSVGLFKLKSWSRGVYLWLTVASLPLLALMGPNVTGPITTSLDTLASVLTGVVLGLLYFSPVKERFGPGS